ncbi:unnamed protein product [Cuscuta epithymum]|uniref:Dof zinc finger protein n=1 Tax=Cuscuta epithymum TaxID=186058 RepID=A0AAV0GGZ6_9ASTE|nr:unnamed protein product [Cuscuta epithymum]CAH9147199.1 unnamed protein product [Cuscuta epithymum]
MSSESGEAQPSSTISTTPPQKSPEPESLPCPRCESTNTKFCYYNNYNLSQPRHFCKACRRYWTRGGTLRNVPVGGGTRKPHSNKRPRTAVSDLPSSEKSREQFRSGAGYMGTGSGCEVNLNHAVPPEKRTESFTSLLCGGVSGGLMSLNGFGLGIGIGDPSGIHGFGFGLGIADWATDPAGAGHLNGGGSAVSVPVSSSNCNTWQMGGGLVEGGIGDGGLGGDYYGWPDLAISAPGRRS